MNKFRVLIKAENGIIVKSQTVSIEEMLTGDLDFEFNDRGTLNFKDFVYFFLQGEEWYRIDKMVTDRFQFGFSSEYSEIFENDQVSDEDGYVYTIEYDKDSGCYYYSSPDERVHFDEGWWEYYGYVKEYVCPNCNTIFSLTYEEELNDKRCLDTYSGVKVFCSEECALEAYEREYGNEV